MSCAKTLGISSAFIIGFVGWGCTPAIPASVDHDIEMMALDQPAAARAAGERDIKVVIGVFYDKDYLKEIDDENGGKTTLYKKLLVSKEKVDEQWVQPAGLILNKNEPRIELILGNFGPADKSGEEPIGGCAALKEIVAKKAWPQVQDGRFKDKVGHCDIAILLTSDIKEQGAASILTTEVLKDLKKASKAACGVVDLNESNKDTARKAFVHEIQHLFGCSHVGKTFGDDELKNIAANAPSIAKLSENLFDDTAAPEIDCKIE